MNKPESKTKVVVTQRFFDREAIKHLEASGCEVVIPDITKDHGDAKLGRKQLAGFLEGAFGWIIGQAHVTRDLLLDRPELLVLSRRGVGYDRVDMAAASELGRVVTIAAGGNDDSVADHTIALMLGVLRRMREAQMMMNGGSWSILVASDLYRKTIGVVGFGRIARSVIKRLSGFDVTVLVNAGAHHAEGIHALGGRPVDLRMLLIESDVVTLHAPLTSETRFMIDHAAIGLMKPSAILINTARGGLVQDNDLLDALRDGRLAGAGLDVFLSEADLSFAPTTKALIALSNVLATPHAAASSREALIRTNRIASDNILAVLNGGSPPESCLIVDGRSSRTGT